MSITTSNLGFPRIGKRRELKFALENFWSGVISCRGQMFFNIVTMGGLEDASDPLDGVERTPFLLEVAIQYRQEPCLAINWFTVCACGRVQLSVC